MALAILTDFVIVKTNEAVKQEQTGPASKPPEDIFSLFPFPMFANYSRTSGPAQ